MIVYIRYYNEKISVFFFVVIEMNRNLRNECLLLCTWTMRGVLENLNSTKKKKIEKISLSLRLNSKSLCHIQRVRAENETTNCWRDQIVCALHVNYLFFTIYSIYLLCLSCFFSSLYLSHSNEIQIYIFNLFYSLTMVHCKRCAYRIHTASYPYGEWNKKDTGREKKENKMPHNWRRNTIDQCVLYYYDGRVQ